MSDFDRNATVTPFGRSVGRAEAAEIDQGLRAYMLHIYNYMVIGLAITGFAALGMSEALVNMPASWSARAPLIEIRVHIPCSTVWQ